MVLSLHHVHMKTPDPKKTIQYYIDNFGATIKGEMTGGYMLDLAGLQINVTEIMKTQNHHQFYGIEHLAMETTDFTATMAQLRANGVEVLEELPPNPTTGKRVSWVQCPDGAQMEVIEKL